MNNETANTQPSSLSEAEAVLEDIYQEFASLVPQEAQDRLREAVDNVRALEFRTGMDASENAHRYSFFG